MSLVPTTKEKVEAYEKSRAVFDGLLAEIRELSKKKPDATLNKSKVQVINRVLGNIREFLKDAPELEYLELLVDDQLPQYSDVVLAMVQYEAALTGFRQRHYGYVRGAHQWYLP